MQATNTETGYDKLPQDHLGWRYSFDIRAEGRIHEIGVDATSGKIVEDTWENAEDEADEAAEDAQVDEDGGRDDAD